MTKKEVTQMSYEIVGCAIRVHKELGPGLLESIYEKCLKYELELNGFEVIQQQKIPVKYRGKEMDVDLRLDLLINFFTDKITKTMKPFVNEYFENLDD